LGAVAYIIAGAPGQDPQDSVADLLYLAGKTAIVGVSIFYPAPGSADFEKCRAQNLLPSALSLLRSTALPISHTTTREDSITLLRLGRILNFFKSLDLAERDEVLRISRQHACGDHGAEIRGLYKKTGPRPPDCPVHRPVSARVISNRDRAISERRDIGKALLAIFLQEGVIYGVSPEGLLLRHRAADALCREFRSGLLRLFS
jgi:hypothetical protein